MALTVHLDATTSRSLVLDSRAGEEDFVEPLFSDVWLGTEVWPAAVALVRALEVPPWREHLSEARLVVELGAGTGACGLAAAALGAHDVLLTDQPSLLPTCLANVAANGMERCVRAEALEWTEALPVTVLPHGADLVLMSDCLNPVYGDTHAQCLAATLRVILSRAVMFGSEREPIGLLAQARRGKGVAEAAFFAACERLGLEWLSQPGMPEEISEANAIKVEVYGVRLSRLVLSSGGPWPVQLAELVTTTKKRGLDLETEVAGDLLMTSHVHDTH